MVCVDPQKPERTGNEKATAGTEAEKLGVWTLILSSASFQMLLLPQDINRCPGGQSGFHRTKQASRLQCAWASKSLKGFRNLFRAELFPSLFDQRPLSPALVFSPGSEGMHSVGKTVVSVRAVLQKAYFIYYKYRKYVTTLTEKIENWCFQTGTTGHSVRGLHWED